MLANVIYVCYRMLNTEYRVRLMVLVSHAVIVCFVLCMAEFAVYILVSGVVKLNFFTTEPRLFLYYLLRDIEATVLAFFGKSISRLDRREIP